MVGYYDVVLGSIPLTLAGITAALATIGVGVTTAIPAAAVVSLGIIGHAMFVSPPTDEATATDVSASPAALDR